MHIYSLEHLVFVRLTDFLESYFITTSPVLQQMHKGMTFAGLAYPY